jgi:AraC-like DNA-binding protein
MNGKKFVSDKSNAILLPKGSSYSLSGDKEGVFPLINFDCNNLKCDEIVVIPLDNPKANISDFNTIKNLFLNNEKNIKIYSAFYEVLDKLSFASKQKNSKLEIALSFIEENLSNMELSNNMIAREIGISEVYLRKLFSAYYDITPKQYILDARIRKAKQMLINTSFTVTAISEKCGFSNLYHFCRAFKQKTGMSPTRYADLNKIYQI